MIAAGGSYGRSGRPGAGQSRVGTDQDIRNEDDDSPVDNRDAQHQTSTDSNTSSMEDRRTLRQHVTVMHHDLIKRLPALCAAGLLCLGATACGTTTKSTSTAATTVAKKALVTSESPYEVAGHSNREDKSVLDFGHAANAGQSRAINSLIKRYYTVAVAENGSKACSMLYSTYAETVPGVYGISPPGPTWARGTSCPAVLTSVFKHFHKQLAVRLPKLKVSRIRIKERQGVVILSFGALPEREIRIVRERHTWRVLALIDNQLP
jgi:hypothetical protein